MYPTVYAALLFVVPMAALAFALLKPHQATAVLMFASMLYLPELAGFDLPGLPAMTKTTLPPLVALIALLLVAPGRLAPARLLRRSDWLVLVVLLVAIPTGLTNREPLRFGAVYIKGIEPWDIASNLLGNLLTLVIPYFVGRTQIRGAKELQDFCVILLGAMVLYVPLIFFELRMSPQLHAMVYGYAQHLFVQTVRAGGYRPMVFTSHGLTLAQFLFLAVVVAWAFVRVGGRIPATAKAATALLLSLTLVLMKSLGALLYAVAMVPLVLLGGRRTKVLLGWLLCAMVLTYPTLRAMDYFPTQTLVDAAAWYSAERAGSLDFRFDNEDILLARAREKPLFGWGPWGRSRVYNSEGRDVSVTDGAWIISYGINGAVGFFAYFGLLANASLCALRASVRLRRRESLLFSALTWVQICLVVDMIPNANGTNLHLYLTGCVLGATRGLLYEERRGRVAARGSAVPHATYERVG